MPPLTHRSSISPPSRRPSASSTSEERAAATAAATPPTTCSGLVTCARCGSRYVGTAAHGRTTRYRYYTCFSRNRYGRHGCQSDRLPADRLDEAVLEALLATYSDSELVVEAIAKARREAEAQAPQVRGRLQAVAAEVRQAEEALERYYSAFESGSLSERRFAGRIEVLKERLAGLRRRQSELEEEAAAEERPIPTAASLADAEEAIKEAIERGTPGQRKALLQALVAEIRVESREAIYPTFRLPAGTVRVMDQVVDPALRRSNHFTELHGRDIPIRAN